MTNISQYRTFFFHCQSFIFEGLKITLQNFFKHFEHYSTISNESLVLLIYDFRAFMTKKNSVNSLSSFGSVRMFVYFSREKRAFILVVDFKHKNVMKECDLLCSNFASAFKNCQLHIPLKNPVKSLIRVRKQWFLTSENLPKTISY